MGKAARNEQIKLRATFYNNIAVGVAVAGVILPYFALTRDSGDHVQRYFEGAQHAPINITKEVVTALLLVLAFAISFTLRRLSNSIAGKIEGN